MKQEMQWLIEQGLYGDNLRRLATLAAQLSLTMPAIYVTLATIFQTLANEYDNQGVETTRYNTVMLKLQDPILNLLKAEEGPAEVLLQRLNDVLLAFHQLMTNAST
jgi:hypothetical protein